MAEIKRLYDLSFPLEELHPNERIKHESRSLRGTLKESLLDPITAGLPSEADQQIIKFHGIYQERDRDLDQERRRKKLEPAYEFMLRIRLPAGVCTPKQWLQLDRIAREFGRGTLKLTTRETFEIHGILKWNLKRAIQALAEVELDSRSACGDVNRNVIATSHPFRSPLHRELYELAATLSRHLLPKTRAYFEVWLDGEPVAKEEREPLYGTTYLPRKFKIALALPPDNDVDLFAHDLGFIAIVEGEEIVGYNVAVGGGMGKSYDREDTYPRLADVIGFVPKGKVLEVAEQVVAIQRDFGNRKDRQRARLKYTIDTHGLEWFVGELEGRLGFRLEKPKPFEFLYRGDRFGWEERGGLYHYTLRVEGGRIGGPLLDALCEIASLHLGLFCVTPNQNLVIAAVPEGERSRIEALLVKHRLEELNDVSPTRRAAIACTAFPTCNLAMAEAERYLPDFLSKMEALLDRLGLAREEFSLRISGCPNGCARPYLAEIALTGRAPGKYDLYLGGDSVGRRLAKPYLVNVGEAEILKALEPLLQRFARERRPGERFGDFLISRGIVS